MDVEQNDDFYVILRGRPANKFKITWLKNPIILDEMRKWRVALTEYSYYYLPEIDDFYFSIDVKQSCMTSTTFKVGAIEIDLKKNTVHYVDEEKIESYDLEHGVQVTMNKPNTFKVGKNSQVIFSSSTKHEITFENEKTITSTYNPSENTFESETSKFLSKLTDSSSVYKFKNVTIKIIEGPYFVYKTIRLKKSDFATFSNVDDMIAKWQPHFQDVHVNLEKNKATNGSDAIFMQFPTWTRQKNAYEDERRVCEINMKNDSLQIFGYNGMNIKCLSTTQEQCLKAVSSPPFVQQPSYLNIITNINAPLRVNETNTLLLRSIYLDDNRKGSRVVSITNPMFVPIENNIIDEIEVEVRLSNGELAPLDYTTESAITLHFRNFS